ncbi:hypothetical protein BCV72DRAFT_121670 [Rhizopus microsporus var. microsporus]|uniref:HIT-type domain-containing protein n=1 Tax=Rhizopus microsporus var. microsporus TaxID=86635 RepID=A0A1X0R3B8_RHIZD|nr:hypothetical protein BCV72DRAFT_121670 [Rhizopus microsporus var. microsporus]CEI85611.1 hypothetical protein RMCBS344292_00070 [Rhizopus microsporus]CEI85612.1 hypothetical protein RMCBS344292_00071 [Rhizopus microsporus]
MSKRVKLIHDPEVHSRHLRRQLESLEKDNHQSLNDVEGLINIALAAQEEEGLGTRKSRNRRGTNMYASKTNLNALLEESPVTAHCYQTCLVSPSIYPARKFCSVCGYPSDYKCLRCGMKYCSTKCLSTHSETRCLKWMA